MIVARILCLFIGYLLGNIQTSYIYGRMNGIDIREHGSGNAGTTNALRVLGKKAGLVVFLGDLFKAVIVCVLARNIINYFGYSGNYIFVVYAGFGAVLGHNFPFHMGFKGGKGIATTAGTILGIGDITVILTCLIVFVAVVGITRYVSLGSILMVSTFATLSIMFIVNNKYNLPDFNLKMEAILSIVFFALLAIYRHRANIVRLIKGEENKIGAKKV